MCAGSGRAVAGPALGAVCFASFVLVLCHVTPLGCRVCLVLHLSLCSQMVGSVTGLCKEARPCVPFHDALSWLVLCVLLLPHVRVSLFLLYFHWSCGQPTLRPACSLVENAMSLTLWDL